MNPDSLLGTNKLVAFIPTTDLARARHFYQDVLGLRLVAAQAPVALVFDAGGSTLRVTTVREHTAAPFTVLGWEVDSIVNTIEQLSAAGVRMLRYPGMNDNEPHGIWTSPAGARVAWFHDADGNVLSITEF